MIQKTPSRTILRFAIMEKDQQKKTRSEDRGKPLSMVDIVLLRAKRERHLPMGKSVVNAIIRGEEVVVVME